MLRSSRGFFGAERVVLDLSVKLAAYGVTACVGCLEDRREPHLELFEKAVDAGLETAAFPSSGRVPLGAIVAVARALKTGGFDLLHVHGYKTLFVGLPAARWARVPVVATLHGETGESASVRLYEALARAMWRHVQGISVVSPGLLALAQAAAPRTPVVHLPNGVDVAALAARVDAARGAPAAQGDGRPVVLAVGRLSIEKGHAVLVEAVARLPEPRPRLVIAGSGVLADPLRTQAGRAGVDLELPGYVGDVTPLLAGATVLAQPSFTEGLPLTVLEGMAAGLPVVATAVGEVPEVLADGAGVVVPPADAGALSEGLASVLADADRRRALGEAARARVAERYDVAGMASRFAEELYRPALGGPK